MTREEKIKLCSIYNNSDLECFAYMERFCNDEQLELLERLVALNTETDLGFEEFEEYYNGKWKLLNSFGIDNVRGDAYFEGVFYD